ncbi:MAG: agmatine/peptidylarginine deiminase [Micrococcales bacterium]
MTRWKMPAEWATHERTWMAWPSNGYTLGATEYDAMEARTTWAAVANAIVEFEPVTMLCNPADLDVAKSFLNEDIKLVEASLDDAWMRDIGPTFVKNESGELGAVNWIFNGWGAQPWASWTNDSKISNQIGQLTDSTIIKSQIVNEGGAIHVNGAGVVLLTETVQLGEGRNSDWTRENVEREVHAMLGTDKAIWLKRGLTRDYDQFGTRGHVDIVACFANEDTILFHKQENVEHPDYEISLEVEATLRANGDFNLIPVAAPKALRDEDGFVDFSYINHYLVNGGVILCSFDDENDLRAVETMKQVYPGRKIVQIDARNLFARGGGIHCITQQQPQ